MQFVSDAPLETITGVTTGLTGTFTFDPAHLTAARGRVSARVASIRTGIDLRDTHLASDHWLDAGRFPNATFEITGVTGPASVAAGQAVDLQVTGRFSIHGQTKNITATVRVRYLPLTPEMRAGGAVTVDVVRVHASFTVRLTDFGISVPDVIRLKVSDDITVNVDLRAVVHTAPAAPPASPNTAPAGS